MPRLIIALVSAAIALGTIVTSDSNTTPNDANAPLTELFRRDGNVFEPNWISADVNHRVWVSDAVHQTLTLYRYNLSSDDVETSLRMGRGPGELSEQGMKWMSSSSTGDRYVYDVGAFRMQRFGKNLDKPAMVRFKSGSSRLLSAHVVSDTIMVVSPMSGETVFEAYRFDPVTNEAGNVIYRVTVGDRIELQPLRNFLLKNGHVAVYGDAIYFSFLFAPYVMKLDATGLRWIGGGELKTGFPVNSKNPNEIRMPDASENPQQSLSITADDKRVYVLHNGEKAGFWKTMWATVTNDFSDIDEQLNTTDRMRVYDARNGSFLEEWKLPVRARLISVYQGHLYMTTQVSGQSTVIAYKLNR